MNDYECHCPCHEKGSHIIHMVACCEGKCPECGKYVTNMKTHTELMHAEKKSSD